MNAPLRAQTRCGVNSKWATPTNIPDDRGPLKDVVTVSGTPTGEGSLVRARAYFMHATHSNTDDGENVNCAATGEACNGIHIYLGRSQR